MKKIILLTFLTNIFIILHQCKNISKDEIKETSTVQRIFPQYSEYTEKIIKTDSSIFRGINLNMSKSAILKTETVPPVSKHKDTLIYNYELDSIVTYTIKYTFINDSLEEINLWIYSNDPNTSTQIFNDLKNYYQKKLPNPIEDKGYVVYNCVQGERRPFVVSVTDFSTPNKGQINLLIYKDR